MVALSGMPPACASVISVTFFTLSFIILSYSFPALLARVMPLSFEHLPLVPLPLYGLIMLPCSQLLGIVSSWCIWLIACLSSFLVVGSASMNTSLGISSGPMLFRRLSFLMAVLISFVVMSSLPCSLLFGVLPLFLLLSNSLIVSVMCFVQASYSGVPGLAW